MLIDGITVVPNSTVAGLPFQKTLSQPGTVVSLVGKVKWSPSALATIKNIVLQVEAVGTEMVVLINKNGTPLHTLTLQANATQVSVDVDYNLIATDYLTVDVVTSGGRSNLTVHLNCISR